MKHIKLLIPFLLSVSCVGGPVKFPELIEHCAPTPDDLRGTVKDLLGGRDPSASLKELGLSTGINTVLCAVRDIQRQLTRVGASADADYSPAVLGAANAFLEESGTQFGGDQ